jgi:hypothetical protein
MNHVTRVRSLALCSVLSLGLAATAFAALPKPTVVTLAPEPAATIEAGVCNIGETNPGNQGLIGPFEGGAAFYQLLDPATCTQCSAVTGRALLNAVIRLRFAFPCSATLRVTIIGALNTGGCYVPDPSAVLCPPMFRTISESAPQASAKNYTIPLSGCCIEGPAFLSIEVVNSDCGPQSVVMPYTTAGCSPCEQYVVSPTYLAPGINDQCSTGFGRAFRMWVEADCCGVTPTLHDTWSRVKTLYR